MFGLLIWPSRGIELVVVVVAVEAIDDDVWANSSVKELIVIARIGEHQTKIYALQGDGWTGCRFQVVSQKQNGAKQVYLG